MNPEVSVILPTYDRAPFLKEALESLAKQTYQDFEAIVVDDGSQDDTESIIKAYLGKFNLISISSPKNHGVSWARNRGIQASHAPWIAFLDSDDLWLPRKLEIQMDHLKKHPELEICQTEEIWIRNGKRVNPMKKHAKSGGDVFKRCLELCVVSPSATVIRRELLDRVGLFDESLPACEDYDLWLRIAYRYPIGLISKPLIIKRGGHTDQLSRKYPAMDLFRIRAIENLLEKEKLTTERRQEAVSELRKKCSIYLTGALKRKNTEGLRHMEKILAEYPD